MIGEIIFVGIMSSAIGYVTCGFFSGRKVLELTDAMVVARKERAATEQINSEIIQRNRELMAELLKYNTDTALARRKAQRPARSQAARKGHETRKVASR